MPTTPDPVHQANNFDALRLLLAASVIVFHTAFLSRAPALSFFASDAWSTAGIHGFFFISGYLVVMSRVRSRTLGSYFEKRARRIAPAYIAAVVGVALLGVFVSRLPAADYYTDPTFLRYVVYNLGLSNFAAPALPGVFEQNFKHAANGSLWTIKIEVMFYLAVPFICKAVDRWGARRVLPALGLASIAWGVGLQQLGEGLHRPFLEQLAVQLPGQLSYFIAGTIAYYRAEAGGRAPSGWLALLGAAIYLGLDGAIGQAGSPLAVYLVMAWASQRMPHLASPNRYGDVSYGIYLLHWPVVQVAILLGTFDAHPWLGALGCWMAVALLGLASWHLVERRFLVLRNDTHRRRVAAVHG